MEVIVDYNMYRVSIIGIVYGLKKFYLFWSIFKVLNKNFEGFILIWWIYDL